jgi:hypothetical protein
VYFLHPLGELQSVVQNGPTGGGTVLNQNIKLVNSQQDNNLGSSSSSRPVDVPPGKDPIGAQDSAGNALARAYLPQTSHPAIDAQGNADCQVGQAGWVRGPLPNGSRYGPGLVPGTSTPTGGNWPVLVDNLPGLRGGTYVTRKLGIQNLRDVK